MLTVGATDRDERRRTASRAGLRTSISSRPVRTSPSRPRVTRAGTPRAARASRRRSSPAPRRGSGRCVPDLDNTQLFEVMRRSATDIGPRPLGRRERLRPAQRGAALAYPAPVRDPLEPNDDVDFVQPAGRFFTGLGPLTSRGRPPCSPEGTARPGRGSARRLPDLAARPTRVRVTATSNANVALRVWGPRTRHGRGSRRPDLLGKDARARGGPQAGRHEGAATGRWAYVEVTLGGRRGLAAELLALRRRVALDRHRSVLDGKLEHDVGLAHGHLDPRELQPLEQLHRRARPRTPRGDGTRARRRSPCTIATTSR